MRDYSGNYYSSEARLIASLCYLFPVVVSVLVLVSELRGRLFLRYHGYQGLAAGIILLIAYFLLIPGATWLLLHIPLAGWAFACLAPFIYMGVFAVQIYWAYLAYRGQVFSIPVVGEIARASMQD